MKHRVLRCAFIAAVLAGALPLSADVKDIAYKINELPASWRLVTPRYLHEKEAEFTVDVPSGVKKDANASVRLSGPKGFEKTLPLPAELKRAPTRDRKNGKVHEIRWTVDAGDWPDGEYDAKLIRAEQDNPADQVSFRVVREWVKKNVPKPLRGEFAVWLKHANRPRDVWKKVPRWRNLEAVFADPNALYDDLRGMVLRSYENHQMQRLQPYTAYVPQTYEGKKPWPLMILLHGSGGDYRNIISDVYEGQELETNPMLIANAGAFTHQEYRHMAFEDVLGVLADMKRKYNVDANRVYVQGISLGGRGSIEMATLRPGVFAAASPQGVYGIFQQAADPVDFARMRPYTRWQLARWDLRSYLPNARGVPMQIIFGHKDRTTPAMNALVIKHLLKYYHRGQAEALGFDAPHNITYPQYKWSDTRKWLLKHRRGDAPKTIHARTGTLRYNRFGWVTIEAMEDYWKLAEIRATCTEKTATIQQVENITRLRLSRADGISALVMGNERIRIDGDGSAGDIVVTRDSTGRWSARPAGVGSPQTDPNDLRKTRGQSGPIWDFCFQPVAIVVGTSGTPEQTDALRKMAEHLQRMDNTWGPAPWPIVKDTDVTDEMKRERNLILVGDTKSNTLLKGHDWPFDTVAGKLPMLDDPNQPKQGVLQFIWPSPFATQRYVYVVSPLDGEAIQPYAIRPQNTWNALTWADWVVIHGRNARKTGRRTSGTHVVDGVFDGNWTYEKHDGRTTQPRYMNWER
ncbi:MAG: hypothetical protein ACOCVI_02560 [Planctomycetota bacterium]